MNIDNYVVQSLDVHLFFGRIMKEHAFFLRGGFMPVNPSFMKKAEFYKREFEELLRQAVVIGNGIVSREVLRSGEIVTEFTALAERQTEGLTGIPIDQEITGMEQRLCCGDGAHVRCTEKYQQVRTLNRHALQLLDGLISFKETILNNVLRCRMFTTNYPLLIEHITREAKLYREYVRMLERDGGICGRTEKEIESFWNQIMMEHAMFIRGLLDPSEDELIRTADGFSKEYAALLETCRNRYDETLSSSSLEKTIQFRDFKMAGAQGITRCQIRSVILPLLADHVLREANHYIRILKD